MIYMFLGGGVIKTIDTRSFLINRDLSTQATITYTITECQPTYSDNNYTIKTNFTFTDEVNGTEARNGTANYTADVEPPNFSNFSRETSNPIYNDVSVTLNSTWSDKTTNVTYVWCRHNATGSFVNYSATKIGSLYRCTINSTMLKNQATVGWNFYANDSFNQWNTTMSMSSFFVQNRAPSKSNLLKVENNSEITDAEPVFNWSDATDPDSDNLTYQIVIDDDNDFSSPYYVINTTAKNTSYFSLSDAVTLSEIITDKNIFWRVRAYDGVDYGNWSHKFVFKVLSVITLTLSATTFQFPYNMLPGETYNRTITLKNDGNVDFNITISSTSFWTGLRNEETGKYQGKISFNETNSYDSAIETLTDLNETSKQFITRLKHRNSKSSSTTSNMTLFITVPYREPAGNKTSAITITAAKGVD